MLKKYLSSLFSPTVVILFLLSISVVKAKDIQKMDQREGFEFAVQDIFNNSSFEKYNAAGTFPKGFRVTKSKADKVTVVNDYEKAFHGNVFLLNDSAIDEIVTYGADNIKKEQKSGAMTMSIWLKGKGTFRFGAYSYDKSRKFDGSRSLVCQVNSEKWKKFIWKVYLPKNVKSKNETRPVQQVGILFYVTGKVAMDKISMLSTAASASVKNDFYISEPVRKTPFMAIPKFKKSPTIDGKINLSEWSKAAKTTGFTLLSKKTFSKRQTDLYVGYDNKNLYVAFRSIRGRSARKKVNTKDKVSRYIDAYEIWVSPDGEKLSHLIVSTFSEGQTYAHGKTPKLDINKISFKSHVEDSGEMMGGVLTFDKSVFTTEVKIPFSALRVKAPKVGDSWKINFCSDFAVKKGVQRQAVDWTTWSQVDSFSRPEHFGDIQFSDISQGVRIDKLGELDNANINLTGEIGRDNGSNYNVLSWVGLNKTHKKIMSKYQLLSAKGDKEFTTVANLSLRKKESMTLYTQVNDIKNKKMLASLSVPFTSKPSFNIELVPDYAKGLLYISLDVAKLSFLPYDFNVKVEVADKKTNKIFYKTTLKKNKGKLLPLIKLQLADINKQTPGKYIVRCFLAKINSKVTLGSALQYLTIPDLKKFVWLNNKFGISDKVLPPWKPVKTEANAVYITERKYILEKSGLPAQVTALNETIFSRKPSITAIVNGKKEAFIFDKLKQIKKTDAAITWKISGQCGTLKIDGTLKIEFDGFALWTVKISSSKKAVINKLFLTFPFKKDQSLYARGADFLSEFGSKYYSALYDYKPKIETVTVAHTPFSLNGGWPWQDKFFNNMWIGNDQCGFGIMIESDEFIFGGKYYEIDQTSDPKSNILKYNFISKDTKIDKNNLQYELAYQATPVKPRPTDPKLWHVDNCHTDKDKEGYQKRVSSSLIAYWALQPLCYPAVYNKASLRIKDRYCKYGVKALPYAGVNMVGQEVPEWEHFKGMWSTRPQGGWTYPRGKAVYTSSRSSFIDYYVWMAKEVVDKLKFDGLYLDVSQPIKSSSQFHGSGYERNGKRYPTANIFAMRELYKRIYNVYNTEGRSAVMYVHQTGVPATAGFPIVTTEGEGWLGEQKKGYSRQTPKIFRLRDMRIQYGTPYTLYSSFNYAYRVKRQYGFVISTEEILARCLPHYVIPAIADSTIWAAWDTLDPWWVNSTFIPYWHKDKIISSNTPEVYASILLKKADKKAIIMCGNWSAKEQNISLNIDIKKLFGSTGKLYVKKLLGGTKISGKGNKVFCTVKGKNYSIIEIGLK
jgi:Glycoside hydrolase 123, N-terminal domain